MIVLASRISHPIKFSRSCKIKWSECNTKREKPNSAEGINEKKNEMKMNNLKHLQFATLPRSEIIIIWDLTVSWCIPYIFSLMIFELRNWCDYRETIEGNKQTKNPLIAKAVLILKWKFCFKSITGGIHRTPHQMSQMIQLCSSDHFVYFFRLHKWGEK